MVNGEFKCLGGIQHLKTKSGYNGILMHIIMSVCIGLVEDIHCK